MPPAIKTYVRVVDRLNEYVGLVSMYLIFLMIAILFYSSISKGFNMPSLWTLDMAQFVLVAYFMLGGGYSLKHNDHVRMDLLYANWSAKRRARVDMVTIIALFGYLGFLFYGSIQSTIYALEVGERGFSSWRPYMAPIKIIMVIGILLMILQAFAEWFKNMAESRGEEIA